ncbi:MAG: thermonuclease family protein [Alphaproteobacteria bacterium]|nr:thermonuclease family protein [Alphaproteobacteria bacterium]
MKSLFSLILAALIFPSLGLADSKSSYQSDKVTEILAFPKIALASGNIISLADLETSLSSRQATKSLKSAKKYLEENILGQDIFVYVINEAPDPLNRKFALIRNRNNELINEKLLKLGLARFQASPYPHKFESILQAAEEFARQKGAGHWQNGIFKFHSPKSKKIRDRKLNGSYQLFQGVVHSSHLGDDYLYVNFEKNWRKDLTLGIPTFLGHMEAKAFQKSLSAGTKIEFRGILEFWNGPFVKLYHPRHLKIIGSR